MLSFFLSTINVGPERDLFAKLYDEYRQALIWHANTYLNDPHDAEDVVQEVFCLLAEEGLKPMLTRSPVHCRRSLFIAVRNRSLSIIEQRKRVVSLDAMRENGFEPAVEIQGEDLLDIISDRQLLEAAMVAYKNMDPKYADVLWMYLVGYSVKQTAELFNEKPETVRKRLYRAKRLLRAAVIGKGGNA